MMDGRAKICIGELVLVTDASGGVGTAVIQLAKPAGANSAIALSASLRKNASFLKLGADAVLN